MRLFAICGQDARYQGLHDMREVALYTTNSEEDALDNARELSYEVIGSYSYIYDGLLADWEEICCFEGIEDLESDEAEDLWEDILNEDLDYSCYELDVEKLPTSDMDKIEEMLIDDFEDFIIKYKI